MKGDREIRQRKEEGKKRKGKERGRGGGTVGGKEMEGVRGGGGGKRRESRKRRKGEMEGGKSGEVCSLQLQYTIHCEGVLLRILS